MNFAQRIAAEKLDTAQTVERIVHQFDMDTCHVALNRCKDQFGWQRIMEFQKI